MGNYAGVDWASEKHDVFVQNEVGEELLAATFPHDEAGLRSLCRQLVRLDVKLVAIERPEGVLVERLLDAGLPVLAIHPNQVAAARPRFRAAGGKSDRFDAFGTPPGAWTLDRLGLSGPAGRMWCACPRRARRTPRSSVVRPSR